MTCTIQDEDIPPMCHSLNYCKAAAFRFNLPSCNAEENNEYVAFILPRIKKSDKCLRQSKITQCQNQIKAECYEHANTMQEDNSCHDNKWSTEYRSTIDELAKCIIKSKLICKREPIYPQDSIAETIEKSLDNTCVERGKKYGLAPAIPLTQENRLQVEPKPSKKSTINTCSADSLDRNLKNILKEAQTIPPKSFVPTKICDDEKEYLCPGSTGNRPMWRCKLVDESPSSSHVLYQPKGRCCIQNCAKSNNTCLRNTEANAN